MTSKFELCMSVFATVLLVSCASNQPTETQSMQTSEKITDSENSSEGDTPENTKPSLLPEVKTGENEMICKTQKQTNSRLESKKVCATRKAWAAQSAQSKRQAIDTIRRSNYGS